MCIICAGTLVLFNTGDLDGDDDLDFRQVQDGEFALTCGCEGTPSPVVAPKPTGNKPTGATGTNAGAPKNSISVVVTAGAAVTMAVEVALGWWFCLC